MKATKLAVMFAVAGLSASAFATDGYFSHGYGMTAKGMGGAATAMTKDAFGGANNPASMVWVGNRLDVGLDLFAPKRSAERTGSSGNGAGMNGSANSGSDLFYIPEFGYNRMLGSDKAVGITIYGNGGMNTDYPGGQIPAGDLGAGGTMCGNNGGFGFNAASGQAGPYNLLCGAGRLGVNLEQLIIAPTFAFKINKDNSFGASLLVGYQRFRAYGLSAFYGYTTPGGTPGSGLIGSAAYAANNNLTDRGNDNSWGYGLRLGWMGKLSDNVTLGAAYATRMKMQKFDKYKDLFAEQGSFDLPENWNVGISFKATPQVTLAADYQRINYGQVNAIANPSTYGGATTGSTLGCANCRGFGWSDIDVIKLGVEYQYNSKLTLRAGYNHSQNPIQSRDVTFNILAPGVVQDHYTLGLTYAVSSDSDLTLAYMHAPEKSVSGASLFNTWLNDNATDKIKMHQDSIGISYSIKFQ